MAWLPASFKRAAYSPLSSVDHHPLLPTTGGEDDEIELEMARFESNERGSWRKRWPRWYYLVASLGCLGVLYFLFRPRLRGPPPTGEGDDWQSPAHAKTPLPDFSKSANVQIDKLFARQSKTYAQAEARYSLRTSRAPPPNFDKWFDYARKHSCLIDEYEQITRDFEAFYQLAEEDPAFFKKMVELGSAKVQKDGAGMTTGKFEKGKFSYTDSQWTLYPGDWQRTFDRFGYFMPDMNIILNGRDEPRVLFNYRQPDTKLMALRVSDPTPFENSPRPSGEYFKKANCLVPNQPKGFTGLANDASAFMIYAASEQFTTDLYPMLSMTKISPCFSDIMVPSEFYYSDSGWSPHYKYENNITWSDKIPKIYWRGMTSGGKISGDNYRAFPRFKLIEIAKTHGSLMDVKLSGFHDELCDKCDAESIKTEYGIAHVSSPREEVYKYKYVFDVDGNSFSGRYLGLLTSGTLVFKSTVFGEYFNDWIRPFEHYIPVLPDLSDLVDKLRWAAEHDAEAYRIQQNGAAFVKRVMTDGQNDCYFSLVLLEWARLQAMARDIPSTHSSLPKPTAEMGEGEANE